MGPQLTDDEIDPDDGRFDIYESPEIFTDRRKLADAATRKALAWVLAWLNSEDVQDGEPEVEGRFAYGGPSSCEYGCLPGTTEHLTEILEPWIG